MNYAQIEPIINAWIKAHVLTLHTEYKDSEVCSVDVVDPAGQKFQIWIDKPKENMVSVHVWDYKKKRRDWESGCDTLAQILEEAIKVVRNWSVALKKLSVLFSACQLRHRRSTLSPYSNPKNNEQIRPLFFDGRAPRRFPLRLRLWRRSRISRPNHERLCE